MFLLQLGRVLRSDHYGRSHEFLMSSCSLCISFIELTYTSHQLCIHSECTTTWPLKWKTTTILGYVLSAVSQVWLLAFMTICSVSQNSVFQAVRTFGKTFSRFLLKALLSSLPLPFSLKLDSTSLSSKTFLIQMTVAALQANWFSSWDGSG